MVRAGISVIWNVLSWSGGHEFEPRSGWTWGAWYFSPKSYLNQNISFPEVVSYLFKILIQTQYSFSKLATLHKSHNIKTQHCDLCYNCPKQLEPSKLASPACTCLQSPPSRIWVLHGNVPLNNIRRYILLSTATGASWTTDKRLSMKNDTWSRHNEQCSNLLLHGRTYMEYVWRCLVWHFRWRRIASKGFKG